VVCGTLVAEASALNIQALREREPDSPALGKYARVGALLAGTDVADGAEALVQSLREWTERLGLQRIGAYGMVEADIPRVVANCRGGSMQTNPLVLSDQELAGLLRSRL
jgi:alcohol dehydrogenase